MVEIERGPDLAQSIRAAFKRVIVGLDTAIESVTIGMLVPGDIRAVMFEGVPGVGKTLLAEVAARIVAGSYQRLTGKADDMPESLTGWWGYVPGTEKRVFRPGSLTRQPWIVMKRHYGIDRLNEILETGGDFRSLPNFDEVSKEFYVVLLYDEVNRSNEQALGAMLEFMQEGKVTIEGTALPMNPARLDILTRNPFDLRQTFDPPAAFWSRILLQTNFTVPDLAEMREIIRNASALAYQRRALNEVEPVLTVQDLLQVREYILQQIKISPAMEDYLARLVKGTEQGFLRDVLGVKRLDVPGSPSLDLSKDKVIKTDSEGQGGGTARLAITLTMLAKTMAYLAGATFVRPEHVRKIFHRAIMHHIFLEKRAFGQAKGSLISRAIADAILEVVDEPPLSLQR
jgi:MoxR-like ATPase